MTQRALHILQCSVNNVCVDVQDFSTVRSYSNRLLCEDLWVMLLDSLYWSALPLCQWSMIVGDPHPGNLLRVSEGPHKGKLALLDFGLVAEIPAPDREAMVSAVIHLANKDWDALIDDFISLNFLPQNCDRALIIPVMDRVLSPYLRGGGAAAFNFQALSQVLTLHVYPLALVLFTRF